MNLLKESRKDAVQGRSYLVVEFESLLSRSDSTQYRKAIDAVLDVGCCSKFIPQHLLHTCNLPTAQFRDPNEV